MAEQGKSLAIVERPSVWKRAITWIVGLSASTRREIAIEETAPLALAAPSQMPASADSASPERREYREIPSPIAFTEWDRVGQVRAILRELEQGQFQRASLLSTLQSRDDRISGCWTIRTDTLLGTPLEFEPAQIDGQVTEETQSIADAAEVDWPKMFQEGSLDRLFRQGKDLGFAFGELVVYEDDETGRWVPRFKPWHTQWAWWNWATDSYWVNTSGSYDGDGNPVFEGAGVIELPRIDRNVYSDGHWVVYAPNGWRYAFQTGIIRSTAMLHLRRQWDMRDQARYNEVYGLLIRVAKVPSSASEPDKDRFAESIRNIGSEMTVECPVDDQGNGYDLDIKGAPAGDAQNVFGGSLHYLDECIGNDILGQAASGEKKSGLGDGDQNQNEAVRQDVLEKDARIADVLKLQVLSWWTLWNFGDRRLCPTPRYMVQPEKSEEQAAAAKLAQGQAAAAIKAAWPNADMDALADELGIQLIRPVEGEEENDDVDPASALNGAQVASLLEIVASVARKELPRDAGVEMIQVAFPIDAKQADRIMGEVGRSFFVEPDEPLPVKETLTVRALSAGVGARKRRPPTYADRLAQRATDTAARVMRPDIAEIKALVAESRTPDELKARLTAHYKRMDPRALADIVERAEIMATLGGRFEVLDDLGVKPAAVRTLKGDFDESKHPRADDGKFGEGGGAGSKPTNPSLESSRGREMSHISAGDVTLYNGSQSKDWKPHVGACFTENDRAAKDYGPHVQERTVDFSGLNVVEVEITRENRDDNDYPGDTDKECAEFEKNGIDVVKYTDETTTNRQHETYRIVSKRAVEHILENQATQKHAPADDE